MNGGVNMIAITGALGIIAMYLLAGWLGYQIGVARGIESERTKRGIRRSQS